MYTTNYTIQMKGTWVVGDEIVTDVTTAVPTFPVCCNHKGQKERGGGINRYLVSIWTYNFSKFVPSLES